LDKQQSYLLYCEKGIMSRLHADAMQKNGFEKIAVFSPERLSPTQPEQEISN